MNSVRNPRPLRTSVLLPTCAVSGRVTPARLAAWSSNIDANTNTTTARDMTVLRIRTPWQAEYDPRRSQVQPRNGWNAPDARPGWILHAERDTVEAGRGTQVVRERSAKPLCVGSIPTRASSLLCNCLASLRLIPFPLSLSERPLRRVLDEQDFVAGLAVDELVHYALRQQDAVPARPQAHFFAVLDVGIGNTGGIGNGCVRQFVAVKTMSRIAHVKLQRALGAHGRNLHHLVPVKGRSVFHGIQQDLAKGQHQIVAGGIRHLRVQLAEKRYHPLGREHPAVGAQRNPVGLCRQDLDVGSPVEISGGLARKFGNLFRIKGSADADEDPRSQSG